MRSDWTVWEQVQEDTMRKTLLFAIAASLAAAPTAGVAKNTKEKEYVHGVCTFVWVVKVCI